MAGEYDLDFRAQPEAYRYQPGEQGVFKVQPYKDELLPDWRFKDESAAEASVEALRTAPPSAPIEVPTLVAWGVQDVALSRRMAAPNAAMCTEGRLEMIEDATHWVQHNAPTTVNRLLVDHLSVGTGEMGERGKGRGGEMSNS